MRCVYVTWMIVCSRREKASQKQYRRVSKEKIHAEAKSQDAMKRIVELETIVSNLSAELDQATQRWKPNPNPTCPLALPPTPDVSLLFPQAACQRKGDC